MPELASLHAAGKERVAALARASSVDIAACYQCGKCTAGCPVAFAMDYPPRQIMRLLQLGFYEEAVRAHAPWICIGCETCVTRCPKAIDIPAVMDALRIAAKSQGYQPEKTVDLFSDLFLDSVEENGRLHEMGMILKYNLQSGQWLKDAGLAPTLYRNKKIGLRAEKIAGRDSIKRIFSKARARKMVR